MPNNKYSYKCVILIRATPESLGRHLMHRRKLFIYYLYCILHSNGKASYFCYVTIRFEVPSVLAICICDGYCVYVSFLFCSRLRGTIPSATEKKSRPETQSVHNKRETKITDIWWSFDMSKLLGYFIRPSAQTSSYLVLGIYRWLLMSEYMFGYARFLCLN